ncbi:MAG: NAD(P)-binding domain-containing protein [Actinomycetes bacterium]
MPFPAPAGTYPTKEQVADYLRGYATAFELPVRLNTRVTRLTKTGDTFLAETSTGTVTARRVVIATGPFQTPVIPRMAAGLAADRRRLHERSHERHDQVLVTLGSSAPNTLHDQHLSVIPLQEQGNSHRD